MLIASGYCLSTENNPPDYFDVVDFNGNEGYLAAAEFNQMSTAFKNSADTKILRVLKSIEKQIASTDNPYDLMHYCTALADTIGEGVNINVATEKDLSPLLTTIFAGNVGLTKLFLNKGADTQLLTRDGLSPLIIALGLYYAAVDRRFTFLREKADNYYKILKALIRKGAKLHLSDAQKDREVACLSALSNKTEGELIETIKKNNLFDADMLTAFLFFVTRMGYKPGVISLIDIGGVNVNSRNRDGNTPLHCAVKYNDKAIARTLLEKKADVYTIENNDGLTAHDTAEIFSPELLALLEGKEEAPADGAGANTHQEA